MQQVQRGIMNNVQMKDVLKKLKLGGILETYEARLYEAREGNLSYEEATGLLFNDELEARNSKSLMQRIKYASFEEEKTFENFDINYYPDSVKRIINHLKTVDFIQSKKHVIILGPTGAGETHLAQALGHQACCIGKKVKFIKANDMFAEFNRARADQTVEEKIIKYSKVDLLIIDDFGLQKFIPEQAYDLYELITKRHIKGSFLITSNRKTEMWLNLFSDSVIASAALDRIVNNSYSVILEAESYRKNFIPKIKNLEVTNV